MQIWHDVDASKGSAQSTIVCVDSRQLADLVDIGLPLDDHNDDDDDDDDDNDDDNLQNVNFLCLKTYLGYAIPYKTEEHTCYGKKVK